MFHINIPRNIILTIFIIFLATLAPSLATDDNSTTGPSNGNSKVSVSPRDGNTGAAAAAAVATGCFARNTLVTLTNHKRIPIQQLRPGDQLLTTNGATIFTTQMMMMLDISKTTQALFHTIITASGHTVSLTRLHLIGVIQSDKTLKFIPAKDVKVGDVLYVMSDDQVILSPVIKIIIEMQTGFAAPLTTSGTILVNGIMASCFSNVRNHDGAQWYFGPLRWYYWLSQSLSISEPFGNQNTEGVHFVPQIMYEFARFFRPTTLQSS